MKRITGRTFLASTAMILALSACENGELFDFSSSSGASSDRSADATPRGEARTETREIERPDLFNVSESGLWDGRPSLGGIWIAHPDVTDPERVRIENDANGRVVNGALFRRERQNPGPRIQVSSDAADALGMLAGKPQELSVVVVREEQIEIAPIFSPDGETDTAVTDAAVDGETAALGAATVDDLGATDAALSATPEAPKPKRPGFFAGLFGSGASQTEPIETEVVAEDGDVVTTTSATSPDVETASLDTIAAASAAIDEAEASAPSGIANDLRNPFVQVGLFTTEENAEAAAASLRETGIVPSVVSGSNGAREFWRVLVGPMTTSDEQTFMLEQIRLLGYSDAFLAPS